jgi:predicted NBD/HSP70 family sugar kinase
MGLTDLNGKLIHKSVRSLKTPSISELVRSTEDCLKEIEENGSIDQDQFLGIGYSLPGDFIGEGSKINAHAYFPELMHIDLREEMENRLPFEIFVENDAACAALGERIHGTGQRFENFILIHLGHGIGSGIIIDGNLYRGSRGNSGIIGVQFPNTKPRPSGQNLLEVLNSNGIDVRDFDDLENLGPTQMAPLKSWIKRASQQLIECLNLTARVLDPEAVILGGRLPIPIIRELVMEIEQAGFCLEGVMLPRPKIYASSLGPEAGVIGTACLAFHQSLFSGNRKERKPDSHY